MPRVHARLGPVLRTRKTLLDAANVALIPLRPLSIGEILDGAFLIVRRNARSLLGLPLVFVAALSLVIAATTLVGQLLGEFSASFVSILILLLQSLLIGTAAAGALVWLMGLLTRASIITVMGDGFAPPAKLTIRQALRFAGPMLALALLIAAVLSLMQGAAGAVNFILTYTLVSGGSLAADGATFLIETILVMVLSVFLGCWLISWLSVAVPVYVAEGAFAPDWVGRGRRPVNVVSALLRSFVLVGWRDSFRVALVLTAAVCLVLLAGVFVFVGIFGILYLFLASLQMSLEVAMQAVVMSTVAGVVGVIVAASLGIAYLSALQALLYLDLRMRREGLDLALRFTVVPVPEPGSVL